MMTKIITLIMLMSLGLCAFGQEEEITDKNLELQALLIDGNKFFILEQYDKAAEKFQDLILMDQTNSAAYYGLSRVSSAKKNYTQAVRQIREALEYEPENTYYLDHLVTNLRYLKDDKALVEAYKRLISLEPEEKKHLYELSKCYERMKDYKSAIDVLEEMEEGSNPAVAYRMADIYTKMGKEKKALTIYEDMVSAHPGQTRYMHMLANHYREIGENDEALEVYKKILDLDPEDSRAGLAIANSQRNTGSDVLYLQSIKKIITGEAINAEIKVRELIPFVQKMSVNPNDALLDKLQEYADILIELHPEEAAVYALAADLYHIKDNSKAALEHYGKSLERRKDVYTVWEQFLLLTSEKKDWEALQERSNEALDFFPNRPKVNMMHGLALYKTGNPAAARSVLMQARMMSANNAILIFEINALLGEVLYELGDYNGSDEAFNAALKIDPDNTDVLSAYAYRLAEQDRRLDDALLMAEKAYKMSDGEGSAILALSWTLAQSGDVERALDIIMEGIEATRDPGAMILERYGDILFLNGREEEAITQWQKALQKSGSNPDLREKIENRSLIR